MREIIEKYLNFILAEDEKYNRRYTDLGMSVEDTIAKVRISGILEGLFIARVKLREVLRETEEN